MKVSLSGRFSTHSTRSPYADSTMGVHLSSKTTSDAVALTKAVVNLATWSQTMLASTVPGDVWTRHRKAYILRMKIDSGEASAMEADLRFVLGMGVGERASLVSEV